MRHPGLWGLQRDKADILYLEDLGKDYIEKAYGRTIWFYAR